MEDEELNNNNMLRLPEVKRRTGLATSTIYKKMAENSFPKAKRISKRAVGWQEEDIQRWRKSLSDYKSDTQPQTTVSEYVKQ